MTEQADNEIGGDTTVDAMNENGAKAKSSTKQEQNDLKEHNDLKEPSYSTRSRGSPRRADEQDAPSRHLWVGNVSMSVTEAELAEQFSRFGDIESVTAYPSRNYAFVNYKSLEDSVYAKKGLQGTVLGGLAIRIEFAKGAKPSRHVWIGNVSSSVTREQLEAECKKFGVVEDIRILHDRNCAFVDFAKTDEAITAFEKLNKKRLGTEELCVEYVKSQLQPKKEGRSDGQPQSDEQATSVEPSETHSSKTSFEKPKRERDEPSEILWVGFPLCMKVDERKLHKAFSPFGPIDRITTFAGRTYAFVQFHSVKAATRAKNVLQGKLFNDPRVSISFAKSEIGPVDHHARGLISPSSANANMPPLLPSKPLGFVNPRGDRFIGFQPPSPSFRRRHEGDMDEAGMFFRHEAGFHGDMDRPMRPWGSPALPEGAFIHPRHAPHLHQERWAFQEEALGRHEHKRPRVGSNHSGRGRLDELSPLEARDEAFQLVTAQDYISNASRMSDTEKGCMDAWEDSVGINRPPSHLRGQSPRPNLDSSKPFKDVRPQLGISQGHSGEGFQWQGVIAKSGTTVCRARCYSIGKSTDFAFPEVVNCTARTSLDMLAKHISEVGEYYLVSFFPFGDLDVQWYQDFVVYLSEKNRAAVCKLTPESTLFLVPPSDFVEHFLKAPKGNNNNILGVFLKLRQPAASSATEQTGNVVPTQADVSAFMYGSYQKPTIMQASMEHKLPPMQVPPHGMPPSPEVMGLPPHTNVHSSTPAGSVYAPTASVGMASSFLQPNRNLPSHGPIIEDRQQPAYTTPPGYSSMPQMQPQPQHSTPQQPGSLSFAPTSGDLHLSQGVHAGIHTSSSPGQYPTDHFHHGHMRAAGQNLSLFSQHPPLPQYPHPSTQQPQQQKQLPQLPQSMVPTHSDQVASHAMASQSSQPPPLMQPPLHAPGGALLSRPQLQHPMAPTSTNFSPAKIEEWSVGAATTTPVSHPPPPLVPPQTDDGGRAGGVDSEQKELLRLAQQKLSEARGESGEDSKRFQATLELAAALLQQLQQKATK